MHSALLFVQLFAQQARYDNGLAMFKWGLTMTGVGILVAAAGLMFSKSKGQPNEMSPTTKLIAGAIVAAIGLAVIAYAWLAF